MKEIILFMRYMGVGMYVFYGSDKVKFLTVQLPEVDDIS